MRDLLPNNLANGEFYPFYALLILLQKMEVYCLMCISFTINDVYIFIYDMRILSIHFLLMIFAHFSMDIFI